MLKNILLLIVVSIASLPAMADSTGPGKVLSVVASVVPICRVVVHMSATNVIKRFSIDDPDDAGSITATLLAAAVANTKVNIWYDPAVTSGCGTYPAVLGVGADF